MEVWPFKDPDEVLDYKIDWAERLDGDTVSTSTWLVPVGVTKDSDTFTSSATIIWLSGGTDGEAYVLTNRITTAAGRTMDMSVKLKVKPK